MYPLDPGFTNVDQTADPGSFVHYLDVMTGLAAVQAYKVRSLELLEPHDGGSFLDIGCGLGEDACALAHKVGASGRVVGVDLSETMVDEARKRAADLHLPVEFQVGDAYHLGFPDDSFDGSRADRVLQHLAEPHRALTEMVRVTRAGGCYRRIYLRTSWQDYLRSRIAALGSGFSRLCRTLAGQSRLKCTLRGLDCPARVQKVARQRELRAAINPAKKAELAGEQFRR